MMKKIVLMIGLLTVFAVGSAFAESRSARSGDDSESRSAQKRLAKERKKLEKEHKKAERQLRENEEERLEREEKVREKEKKERRQLERKLRKEKKAQAKAEKSSAREERSLIKQEKKAVKEERKAAKQEKKVAKVHARLTTDEKKEKREHRELDLQVKEQQKKEQRHLKQERRLDDLHELAAADQKRVHDQVERYTFARHHRAEQMHRWNEMHALELERDHEAGRWADLYKAPTWPVASWFFENKDNLVINMHYNYATDSYGSDRSRMDVTALEFGQKPIYLKTINQFLYNNANNGNAIIYAGTANAARMIEEGVARMQADADRGGFQNQLALANGVATVADGSTDIASTLITLARTKFDGTDPSGFMTVVNENTILQNTSQIRFNGKAEEYGTSLDFARYILADNVQVGVQMPVLYKHHKLESNYSSIMDILNAKGIYEKGGSATGVGDIVLFANLGTGARTFEKMMTGLKVTLPTGKSASTAKLWAPELGEGYTKFTPFASMLMSYNRMINPHIYVEGTWAMPAYFNKRIPNKITVTDAQWATVKAAAVAAAAAPPVVADIGVTAAGGVVVVAVANNGAGARIDASGAARAALAKFYPAWGDKIVIKEIINAGGSDDDVAAVNAAVAHANITNPFTAGYDTSVRGFGDTVTSVKIERGLEAKLHVGNIIEKFIARRGFLDIFYDLNIKWKDEPHGLDEQTYDVNILRENTHRVAHKLGAEYQYQFDAETRWRLGLTYTFAGLNAPKTVEVGTALGYSF